MEPFLTDDETRAIQRLYEKWNKHAQPDVLMSMFYSRNMVGRNDMSLFDAQISSLKKNEFLFKNILETATYDDLCKVRDVLNDSAISAHIYLASQLPVRQPEPQANPAADPDRHFYNEQTNYNFGQQNTGPNQQQQFHQPQTGNQYPIQQSYDSQTNQPPPQPENNMTPNLQLLNATPNQQQNQPGQDHTETPAPAGGVHSRVRSPAPDMRTLPREQGDNPNTLRLKAYDKKNNGQGLCVILANFTEDMTGYVNDICSISEFFGKTLQYKLFGAYKSNDEHNYRNLTSEEFKVKLRELQVYLNDDQNNNVDRLFVFVLSHGDESGIKMYPPDNETDNSKRDRIKTETIVDMFTHDNVPALKGLPKCFFIQVCSGTEETRAANNEELESKKPCLVAVGADTLVCHAAKKGTYSWVTNSSKKDKVGSWFIQATIDVFQNYHKQEHVLDMMTEVNDRISTKTCQAQIRRSGDTHYSSVEAYQLPAISNYLTRKFYLA